MFPLVREKKSRSGPGPTGRSPGTVRDLSKKSPGPGQPFRSSKFYFSTNISFIEMTKSGTLI